MFVRMYIGKIEKQGQRKQYLYVWTNVKQNFKFFLTLKMTPRKLYKINIPLELGPQIQQHQHTEMGERKPPWPKTRFAWGGCDSHFRIIWIKGIVSARGIHASSGLSALTVHSGCAAPGQPSASPAAAAREGARGGRWLTGRAVRWPRAPRSRSPACGGRLRRARTRSREELISRNKAAGPAAVGLESRGGGERLAGPARPPPPRESEPRVTGQEPVPRRAATRTPAVLCPPLPPGPPALLSLRQQRGRPAGVGGEGGGGAGGESRSRTKLWSRLSSEEGSGQPQPAAGFLPPRGEEEPPAPEADWGISGSGASLLAGHFSRRKTL